MWNLFYSISYYIKRHPILLIVTCTIQHKDNITSLKRIFGVESRTWVSVRGACICVTKYYIFLLKKIQGIISICRKRHWILALCFLVQNFTVFRVEKYISTDKVGVILKRSKYLFVFQVHSSVVSQVYSYLLSASCRVDTSPLMSLANFIIWSLESRTSTDCV